MHYAATHEQVLHLEDVMIHRTRLSYEVRDSGRAATDEILEVIAPVLGWDEAKCAQEKASYLAQRDAEDAAALAPTDEEADTARRSAPDVTPMVTMTTE